MNHDYPIKNLTRDQKLMVIQLTNKTLPSKESFLNNKLSYFIENEETRKQIINFKTYTK